MIAGLYWPPASSAAKGVMTITFSNDHEDDEKEKNDDHDGDDQA